MGSSRMALTIMDTAILVIVERFERGIHLENTGDSRYHGKE